jgi:prepilin-type N-terminal cleavage/methylation domain-containing protein
MNLKNRKEDRKKEEGFTLVEVIAVLVILGILAAVAVPKFFDMQETARQKAVEGAIGELNGQVALSFAKNALDGGPSGDYALYTGYLGEAFDVFQGAAEAVAGTTTTPGIGKIVFHDTPTHWFGLNWRNGDTTQPGFYKLGGYQADGVIF